MSEILWSVDSLVVKDNTLFGFGWAFHESLKIKSIQFKLSFQDDSGASCETIHAEPGKPRDDVASAFKQQAQALHSGYVVFGAFRSTQPLKSIHLVCGLSNHSSVELNIPESSITQFSTPDTKENKKVIIRQVGILFKRGLHLIRSGKIPDLLRKIKRYANGRPKISLHDDHTLSELIGSKNRKGIYLIVDHDLGGGANYYRNKLTQSLIDQEKTVLIFTYHVATLSHVLILKDKTGEQRLSIPSKEFLLESIRNLNVTEIIYNTAVSFARPEEIPQLLINIKHTTSARLRILIHDYFSVCPSHFLIAQDGQHCRLPATEVCTQCLPTNQQGFATLFRDRDIKKWRSVWGALLAAADEIVSFSSSSKDIILKAYPQIPQSTISIIPHEMGHLPQQPVHIKPDLPLCIGVVGHIGFHKGSIFIQDLSREIKARSLNLKIIIIGAIEASCEPGVVEQTGLYQHDELPGLIEKSGANVFLFPSICPETFSYVVHELMALQLPIASFDFGAQAEKLSDYSKGLVLDSMDPGVVLDRLIEFHHTLYSNN